MSNEDLRDAERRYAETANDEDLSKLRQQRCQHGQCCAHADLMRLTPVQWNILAQCFDRANFASHVVQDAAKVKEALVNVMAPINERLQRDMNYARRRAERDGD